MLLDGEAAVGGLAFDGVWSGTSQDGPLLSFKRLLQEQGLEEPFLAVRTVHEVASESKLKSKSF